MAVSKKNNNRNNNRNKNNRSVKKSDLLQYRNKNVTFAAKLGAFICQGQKLADVVGNPQDGFNQKVNGRDVNQRVFGVLPFLHLNITEAQFVALMNSVKGDLSKATTALCNKNRLEKTLKKVSFNCTAQGKTGVENGIMVAILESINNRWNVRQNGRKVLDKVARIQMKQVELGIIPEKSIHWCK